MKIKKFEAANMRDALEKIKEEMGPDAFILATKTVKRKGPLGFGERTFLQVTAAVEQPLEDEKAGRSNGSIDLREDLLAAPSFSAAEARPKATGASPAAASAGGTYNIRGKKSESAFTEGFETVFAESRGPLKRKKGGDEQGEGGPGGRRLRRELMEIRSMVEELKKQSTDLTPIQKEFQELKSLLYNVVRNQDPLSSQIQSTTLLNFYRKFVESGMVDALSAKLIQITDKKMSAKDKEDAAKVWLYLRNLILKSVDVAGPLQLDSERAKLLALIGPTGVGKTTTIAKLAAHAALQLQTSVALITLDTYRIAAVDQLKNYAKIMEIPIQVALNVNELRRAIQFHQDKSLILIDTAGHSHYDQEKLENIKQFLTKETDIEAHLVLSATTKPDDLNQIVNKFKVLEPKYLVFTKLDETRSYGALFNQLVKTRLPVSYLTTGQQVPEDLEFAKKEFLANLFMGYSLDKVLEKAKD